MTTNPLQAASTYAAISRIAADAPRAEPSAQASRPDFSGLVQQATASAVETIAGGEQAATAVAQGGASLVDVVTAVSAAEVTLETAIAVRNRVIEAYQEIMRMPI